MDTKSAVIFYNHQPLAFRNFKKYDIGTGYVVIYDNESSCFLCRILDEREIPYYKRSLHRLVLNFEHKVKEYSVIVIISEKSLSYINSTFTRIVQATSQYVS